VFDHRTYLTTTRKIYKTGVFCGFIPQAIEQLIWESEATKERLAELEKRGITPVIVPDGDKDHMKATITR
jgi:hypothetical protein